jgi:hypothetical protein
MVMNLRVPKIRRFSWAVELLLKNNSAQWSQLKRLWFPIVAVGLNWLLLNGQSCIPGRQDLLKTWFDRMVSGEEKLRMEINSFQSVISRRNSFTAFIYDLEFPHTIILNWQTHLKHESIHFLLDVRIWQKSFSLWHFNQQVQEGQSSSPACK